VCCLCDTSPTLFEQLARKVSRGTYPTRGEHVSPGRLAFTHAMVAIDRLPQSFRARATKHAYCAICQKFGDEWPAPLVCEGPTLLRPHLVPCTWCDGQGFLGTRACTVCHGTGREA
jgi:hypothetical protein